MTSATKDENSTPKTDKAGEEDADLKLPWIVRKMLRAIDRVSSTFLGGPRCVPYRGVINFQKGGTLVVCIALMRYFNNYSITATTYTALHGGYGLCWFLKDCIFPDPKWEPKITIGSAIAVFTAVLGPYWVIAYNAIGRGAARSTTALCGATITFMLGLCVMMGADGQKFFVTKLKRGLITDGFFSLVRHPNYLGEMMIYGSFAYVSCHPSSWVIVTTIWTGLFLPFMLRKEARMSRYPEWTAYKARTGFLLPRLFGGRTRTAPKPEQKSA